MGKGMAHFVKDQRVVTKKDYHLYTHFVAGLVGIGLTDLFVASGLESQSIKSFSRLPTEKEPSVEGTGGPDGEDLANRMGLFLQKVNILKDYLQDLEEGRIFWPEEIWRSYAPNSQTDKIDVFAKSENLQRGLAVLNQLCADALQHVPDCLEYMSRLRNKTVFQFCAIPQVRLHLS
jgi:farnesyl-diphosphate farnesyltransferase